jgi:hypothetical protein
VTCPAWTRGLIAALVCALLAACAQNRDKVAVGIGTAYYVPDDARPYAALYLPYARMASLAYTDLQFLARGKARPYCPDVGLLRSPGGVDATHPAEDNQRLARWLLALDRDWQCLSGGVGPLNCPKGVRCVDGLQYQVWRRRDCSEAVIAFRGTDRTQAGDWLTNLHWLVGRWFFDQYEQVQEAIPDIIRGINAAGCRPRRIIATGHSLGGGLAQHVAYADARIDYVYAFDPSPVTAFFGVPLATRTAAVGKLGIDRIYEHGEVLSLPRYLASGLFPTSQCQPRVRIVRFATAHATSAVARHGIARLTESLEKIVDSATVRHLPRAYDAARTCNFVRPGEG